MSGGDGGVSSPWGRCKESTCPGEEVLLIKRGNDLPLGPGGGESSAVAFPAEIFLSLAALPELPEPG